MLEGGTERADVKRDIIIFQNIILSYMQLENVSLIILFTTK